MLAGIKSKLPDALWKKIVLLIFAVFIVTFLLYIGTVHSDFLKDDFRLIVENPRVKDFKSFMDSIDGKFFAFPDFPYLHYWRPLTLFTFYLDYKLWGLNPSGYHFTNILLNALNGILIFLIFYFITSKLSYSFFIAFFFAVHPSHVEAVSWVSGRTDLLASFFIFSALFFFILFIKKGKLPFYFISALSFILALLSKENAVLFPLAAVVLTLTSVLDKSFCGGPGHTARASYNGIGCRETNSTASSVYWDPQHGGLAAGGKILAPLFLIDIGYILLHNKFSGVQDVLRNFSFADISGIFKTVGIYVKIILAPFFPSPYFSMQDFERLSLQFYIYSFIALVVLGLMVYKRREYRGSFFALIFFIFILPVLDPELVPSYPKIVIRFAYIPAIFAGVFFMDTKQLFRNKRLRNIYIVLLCIIACIWAVETYRFQVYFKNGNEHYQRLVEDFPEDGSIVLPLALLKAGNGEHGEALRLVNHALAASKKDPWLDVSELGGLLKANLLVITGKPEEGKEMAKRILEETKKDEMKYFAFMVLSKYHEKKGDLETALEHLKRAGSIGETADLFYRLVIIYGRLKDYDNALLYLEKAKALNQELPRYLELKQILINEKNKANNTRSVTGD